jgi:hypothetical protein
MGAVIGFVLPNCSLLLRTLILHKWVDALHTRAAIEISRAR